MTVSVNREEFLRSLESVQPGLAARDTVEQSSSFVFHKGKILTYNTEVACRRPSPLGKEFKGAVQAKKLLELLSKMTEDEVVIEQGEGEFIVRGHRRTATRNMETEILLPLDQVERPQEYALLHKEFCEAIGVVQECAKITGDFKQVAVHIHPEFVEANDRFQLCRWKLDTGFQKSTLVRKDSVRHITGLAMSEFAETPNWVHFRNADKLELSCRRYAEDYPDYTPFLDVKGSPSTLPKGFVAEADLGELYSSENSGEGNNRVLVEVRPSKSRLTAHSVGGRYVGPWRKTSYDGEPFTFLISPKMLAKLVEKHNECVLTEGRLAVYAGSYVYVAWLSLPPKEKEDNEQMPMEEMIEEPAYAEVGEGGEE